ncbi:MAG: hypothetical protein JWN86_106 [Planctomycetota bacterium]|nr:hypothetical protein [Planctomycetota bacterium]
MDRSRLFRMAFYLLLIIAIRVQLFHDFPLLLTADSWDFLHAAKAIAERLDFSDAKIIGLRDCRVPGYPIFQATWLPFTCLRSDRILLVQAALGLAGVLIGWGLGRTLRSPRTGEMLAVFLGINPIGLIYEHSMMSEGLCLVMLLAFTLVALPGLREGPSIGRGVLIGIMSGTSVLVRINVAPFVATLIVGIILARKRGDSKTSQRREAAKFVLACGLASALIIGPWIFRNYNLYHKISLNMFQTRALLLYKSFHHPLVNKLPEMRQVNASLGKGGVSYDWLWELTNRHGTVAAEEIAGRLLREQWKKHPGRHLMEMAQSVVCFGGLYESSLDDRSPMRYWFEHLVCDVSAVNRLYSDSESLGDRLGLRYMSAPGDTVSTRAWAAIGRWYLLVFRPVLSIAFVGSLISRRFRRRLGAVPSHRDSAVRWLSLGYLATVAFHAATLTDSDRFSSLYDWVPFMVVVLVAESGFSGPGPVASTTCPQDSTNRTEVGPFAASV